MKKVEAFLTIAVAAIAADGVLHHKEAEVLKEHLNNQKAFKSFDHTKMIKSIIEVIKIDGYKIKLYLSYT